MSSSNSGRARVVLGCIFSLTSSVVIAQEAVTPLPPVVVTATRGPLDVARAGSAIDVVTHDDIERLGATGLRDVLQAVPGLFVHDSGGFGSTSNVTLRGSNPGQTLVLIDGVRVGDPTGTDGAFDFGALALGDIERIEVLRGPQSALYGSRARDRRGNRSPSRAAPMARCIRAPRCLAEPIRCPTRFPSTPCIPTDFPATDIAPIIPSSCSMA